MKNVFVLLLAFIATSFAITARASQFQQTRGIAEITVLLVYKDGGQQPEGMIVSLETPQQKQVIFTDFSQNTVATANNKIKLNAALNDINRQELSYASAGQTSPLVSLTTNEQNMGDAKPEISNLNYSSLNYLSPNSSTQSATPPSYLPNNYSSLNLLDKSRKNPNQVMF